PLILTCLARCGSGKAERTGCALRSMREKLVGGQCQGFAVFGGSDVHGIAIANLASEQLARHLVTNSLLDQTTQWTCAVVGVVATFGEPVLRVRVHIELQTTLLQALG